MKKNWGFTFVELIVAVSLMAIVMGTMVATFMGGSRLWQRFQHAVYQDQSVRIALEEIARQLRNARLFAPIPFSGEYDRVAFPSLVKISLESEEDVPHREIGERSYFLKERDKILCSSENPYRLMRHFTAEEKCHLLCEGVDRLRFQYYRFDPAQDAYVWSNDWDSPEQPLAVKIEMTYHDLSEKTSHTQTRIVHLPTAAVR